MNDDVNQQLRQWKVTPRIPDGFQREVWARIATRQAAPRNFWPTFMEWMATPRYATVAFVVAICGSAFLGMANANETNQQAWKSVQDRYAMSLNPIAHAAGMVSR